MNVKTFASMVRTTALDSTPLHITLCAGPERDFDTISVYDPENPFHIAAFGNWKIKSVTAAYENGFDLVIDTVSQIVTEN